jgi:hypothetical protein
MAKGLLALWVMISLMVGLGTVGAQTPAPQAVDPPFGLKWGAPPAGLVDWAARFKLDVLVKALGDRPRQQILIISARKGSLPSHESTSLEAHFVDGRLFEVSVHYTYPGKSTDFVRARHDALKALLSKKFGPLKFNGSKKSSSDGIATVSEASHAEVGEGIMVMLALTEVRDTKRGDAAARFTLLYRNERILTDS